MYREAMVQQKLTMICNKGVEGVRPHWPVNRFLKNEQEAINGEDEKETLSRGKDTYKDLEHTQKHRDVKILSIFGSCQVQRAACRCLAGVREWQSGRNLGFNMWSKIIHKGTLTVTNAGRFYQLGSGNPLTALNSEGNRLDLHHND